MSLSTSQYEHYIPRFILKAFHQHIDDAGHLFIGTFDVSKKEHSSQDVRKFGGWWDLYEKADDSLHPNSKRVEDLLSILEANTGQIVKKIKSASHLGNSFVDLSMSELETLRKFFFISIIRVKWLRDQFVNEKRQNSHVIRDLMLESAKKRPSLTLPELIWLGRLRYMLESSYTDLMKVANLPDAEKDVLTFQKYEKDYSLFLWKASDGAEFMMNDQFVQFEGDTENRIGCNSKAKEIQLWTLEIRHHVWLPLDPRVAVVLCHSNSCHRPSNFIDILGTAGLLISDTSLLWKAEHKEPSCTISKPNRKSQKSTETIRFPISVLDYENQRIISAYSLSHASEFIVYRDRSHFERSIEDLEVFSAERAEAWRRRGALYSQPPVLKPYEDPPDFEEFCGLFISQYLNDDEGIETSTLVRNRSMMIQSYAFVNGLSSLGGVGMLEDWPGVLAMKKLLVETYEPRSEQSHALREVTWREFAEKFRDRTFVEIIDRLDQKISDLLRRPDFETEFGNANTIQIEIDDQKAAGNWLKHKNFRSVFRSAVNIYLFRWLYETRQDILHEFILPSCVRADQAMPKFTRFELRSRQD